jgi:hypothetical protein
MKPRDEKLDLRSKSVWAVDLGGRNVRFVRRSASSQRKVKRARKYNRDDDGFIVADPSQDEAKINAPL